MIDEREQFRLLIENVVDYAMIVMDRNGIIVNRNTGAERILGYSEEEAIGLHAAVIFTAEDRDKRAPEQELQIAAQQGRAEDVRWHQRKDDSLFWGDGIVTPLREENGELEGFVKIFRDRTAAKQIQDKLEAECQRERRNSDRPTEVVVAGSLDGIVAGAGSRSLL